MNPRIEKLRDYVLRKEHHGLRRTPARLGLEGLNVGFAAADMPPVRRSAEMLSALMRAEQPVILPGERIVFTRTVSGVPDIFTPQEWARIEASHYIHERGTVCNISPDYEATIRLGLEARKAEVTARLADDRLSEDQRIFLGSVLLCIGSVQELTGRYAAYAREAGQADTAQVLEAVRTCGARSLREALQLLRILHFALWEAGNYHNTLGRFDQYMYPYFRHDIDSGVLTEDEAFDLVEEFFLACNKDSDLYPGMQQGDNGQSMVLGGRAADGTYLFNRLSEMCLRASCELELIDPKINIRVDRDTPDEIFEMGSQLTRKGLGFPQYCNDDVVIPGLLKKGYSQEDARNYVVAACWEFIIPGCAMDIPNIDAVSLAGCVREVLPGLAECPDYETFYGKVERRIAEKADAVCARHRNLYVVPAPMMSLLMDGTVERAQDISVGARYNNYGLHGTGIATAVDSLAALRKFYFGERRFDAPTLLAALENDFRDAPGLQRLLRREAPKMGQDDDYADSIACDLLASFARALEGRRNERGGVYRAGTGTAMYYVFHATELGATPDGRNAGEMVPANYSPSLFIDQRGPVSVIRSFTKPCLADVVNGGPLTLEFDRSVFNSAESVQKLGMLVKTYIALGGHQLQLNTVSRGQLLDAKAHPGRHRNLIVRVWGWSGYFVELDECYQNHVIDRIEFGL